jgi:hypothetical protein
MLINYHRSTCLAEDTVRTYEIRPGGGGGGGADEDPLPPPEEAEDGQQPPVEGGGGGAAEGGGRGRGRGGGGGRGGRGGGGGGGGVSVVRTDEGEEVKDPAVPDFSASEVKQSGSHSNGFFLVSFDPSYA